MHQVAQDLFIVGVVFKTGPKYVDQTAFFQKTENKIRIAEYRVDWWLWKEFGIIDPWIIPLDRTELISLRVVLDNATCRGEEDATSVLVIDIEDFPKSFACPLSTVASDRAIVCCLDDGCTARMYSAIVIEH